jgi:hypothetical protein
MAAFDSHIAVGGGGAAGPQGQGARAPGEGAHAGAVAAHGAELLHVSGIPELGAGVACADGKVLPTPSDPRGGGDEISGVLGSRQA